MIEGDKDHQRLFHIIKYCEKIDIVAKAFKGNYNKFLDNKNYQQRDLCSFYILQLGELAIKLTDEFTQKHNEIPWGEIRGMRNAVAHRYGTMDIDIIWEVITDNIPELNKQCRNILKEKDPNFEKDLQVELKNDIGKTKDFSR